MKLRHKHPTFNAKARKAKPRPNPLKMDPSRTATLRRQFAADLKRRFARLRMKVYDLVVRQDAFGLAPPDFNPFALNVAANAFCPTGEGGGMDNTCSPGGGGGGSSDPVESAHSKYEAIKKDLRKISVDEMRSRFAEIAKLPKAALAGVLKKLGYTADGSKKDLADKLLDNLTSLKISHDQTSYIGNSLTANGRQWAFQTSPEKIKSFKRWLRSQVQEVTGREEDELFRRYIEEGFRRGAGRAFDDTTKARLKAAGKWDPEKQAFLKDAFGRSVSIDKVKILVGRVYDDMEGVTRQMATRMTRSLADGLVQGKGPREVGRLLAGEIDISVDRATTIARTELVRSASQGQLVALEQMGVEEVGVMVEFSTTGDDKVCPQCESLQGVVLKLEEAQGIIPQHPNCRCAFIPSNVGESTKDQKRSKSEIDDAFGEDGPSISKDRPEAVISSNQYDDIAFGKELLEFSRWANESGKG